MRQGITVEVSSADRAHLQAIVADRNSRQKHVWRARIVLLTADGVRTNSGIFHSDQKAGLLDRRCTSRRWRRR